MDVRAVVYVNQLNCKFILQLILNCFAKVFLSFSKWKFWKSLCCETCDDKLLQSTVDCLIQIVLKLCPLFCRLFLCLDHLVTFVLNLKSEHHEIIKEVTTINYSCHPESLSFVQEICHWSWTLNTREKGKCNYYDFTNDQWSLCPIIISYTWLLDKPKANITNLYYYMKEKKFKTFFWKKKCDKYCGGAMNLKFAFEKQLFP